MKIIEEQIKTCPICNMDTKQYRNAKKYNWLMHIFLTLITGGVWLIFLLFPFLKTIMTTEIGNSNKGWICTVCNNIDKSKKVEVKNESFMESLTSYLLGFGAIVIIVTIVIFIISLLVK